MKICVQKDHYQCTSADDQHQTQICHSVELLLDLLPNCHNLSPHLLKKDQQQENNQHSELSGSNYKNLQERCTINRICNFYLRLG